MRDWQHLHQTWFKSIEISEDYYQERMPYWFGKNPELDKICQAEFADWLDDFEKGQLNVWKEMKASYVSLIVLLDQIPRNAFRNQARSFAYDEKARELTKMALDTPVETELSVVERLFFYLPLEHSENMDDQKLSVAKFTELSEDMPESVSSFAETIPLFAKAHLDVIEQFGRFPHRNKALGRKSTPEEEEYLKDPEAGF